MQRFDCPFCGPRDQSEFTYGREVAPIPALEAGQDAWQRYVYNRDNPCGPHAEWWHHNHGCRQWLEIVRDTLTHEVLAVRAVRREGATTTGEVPQAGAPDGNVTAGIAPAGVAPDGIAPDGTQPDGTPA